MAKQLPTELWYRTIQFLPTQDQRTCLSVSKLHHDIAQKYVFSHIIITLGLWRRDDDISHGIDFGLTPAPIEVAEASRLAKLNYALLRHITRTPEFARLVKKLTVRAYSLFEESPLIYEISTLAEAIEALHNLSAFAWFGPLPKLPCEVMDALLRSSGQKVVDFIIHPEFPEDLCLPSFTQVNSLVFRHRFLDLWPQMHAGAPYHKTVHRTIAANSATLRRLEVFGDALWECLPMSFASLHELAIVFPCTLAGLGSVFEHCRELRGFTLCTENDGSEIIDVLNIHQDAFPHLTSFKLLSVFDLDEDVIEEVAKFLKKKRQLRRVDVLSRTQVDQGEDLINISFLKILRDLPNLEILGLDIRPAKMTSAHVKLLEQYVPPQVTALFILFHANTSDVKVVDWRSFFSKHEALRYLHIGTRQPLARSLGNAIFRRPPPNLELLGYNNGLRWVTHDPKTRAPKYSEFWPASKVYFRSVEDYQGHEDWEWLLRHHGQDDDDCDIWSMDPPDLWKRMDSSDKDLN
ncbi:hypothetical protein BD311DRAFT_799355 [Dichomitus squalens]|uniref:F-box domain-containing protein n=1 Tax=Dichomitus squalens TaxID=114155 RepID=A0A4Q9MEQ0_9APHY|nr:hypothetical protein BD311DRAFT_799355 [Dichomitus squalens]